jgi:hypothetical protein
VAKLALELAHQQLARLARRQVGDPLELAQLVLLGLPVLLDLLLEVALAVLERALAALEVSRAGVDCLLLREEAFLDPGDLRAPLAQLARERLGRRAIAEGRRELARLGRPRPRLRATAAGTAVWTTPRRDVRATRAATTPATMAEAPIAPAVPATFARSTAATKSISGVSLPA